METSEVPERNQILLNCDFNCLWEKTSRFALFFGRDRAGLDGFGLTGFFLLAATYFAEKFFLIS